MNPNPCPYRVRDFEADECNRTNCLMTAFEVLNGEALYRKEITISTERCEFTDKPIEICHCPDCDPSYPLDHIEDLSEPTNVQALRDAEADDIARMQAFDDTAEWPEPHPEITQDHHWASRLMNLIWSVF